MVVLEVWYDAPVSEFLTETAALATTAPAGSATVPVIVPRSPCANESAVDTSKAEVMRQAIDAGADLINDIRSLQEPGALEVAAEAKLPICLMHMKGQPRTMQVAPHYDDLMSDVSAFLEERIAACEAANRLFTQPSTCPSENGPSGMQIPFAPPANPALSAIQPALRPMTSTTKMR